MAISESQFYVWRTLFALVHADNVVTKEECEFMQEALNEHDFSGEQRVLLMDDIANPKNALEMFRHITDEKDQSEFFHFAHDLMWVDGDYDPNEERVMKMLREEYDKIRNVRPSAAIEIAFEDTAETQTPAKEKDIKGMIDSFKDYLNRND